MRLFCSFYSSDGTTIIFQHFENMRKKEGNSDRIKIQKGKHDNYERIIQNSFFIFSRLTLGDKKETPLLQGRRVRALMGDINFRAITNTRRGRWMGTKKKSSKRDVDEDAFSFRANYIRDPQVKERRRSSRVIYLQAKNTRKKVLLLCINDKKPYVQRSLF